MASGSKRGAGDRVLESKHVIGLFLLMLLFSGVFFSLGYVMGRSQYDGRVQAESNPIVKPGSIVAPKSEAATKKKLEPPASNPESEPPGATDPAWKFSDSNKPAEAEPRLEPRSEPRPEPRLEAAPKPVPANPAPKSINGHSKTESPAPSAAKNTTAVANTPLIPSGAILLQVAALKSRDEALSIASSLQKKHFAAYVLPPQKDKYYRVQVGPLNDQKSADAAKKGLESAGFKAFIVKH
jgi:DedD protein